MNRILSLIAFLFLLASPSFAAVGINVNGTTVGTAGNLYVNCNTGGSPFINGFDYSATCSNNLVADGTANGGYTSLGTIDSGISLTNALIKKTINGTAGTATDTLPAGTPNQIITIEIVGAVTGTWVVTPAAGANASGWSSVTFNSSLQMTTFLYVNSTIGWIIMSNDGSAASQSPTIADANGQ